MKERPILMSAPMVRAILAGTKTQTRRVVKPPKLPNGNWMVQTRGGSHEFTHWDNDTAETSRIACPYGQPGDRMWVREAWAKTQPAQLPWPQTMIVYREGDNRTDYGGPWKPGIHMFRRDSRITLEITEVRVERLQDISEADALAEGYASDPTPNDFALPWYRRLWEQINGPGSWDANPWVWAVSFKRVEAA